VSFATNFPDYSVAIGDFNQDGNADLALGYAVVTEYSYSYCDYTCYDCYFWGCGDCYTCYDYYYYETDVGVTVLEGSGNGTFGPETDVATNSYGDAGGESVPALAVSDFDRKGIPDLAAVESTGSVDMLLNTSPRVGLQIAVSPASDTAGVARSVTVSAFDL